jgi:hypothetical protein
MKVVCQCNVFPILREDDDGSSIRSVRCVRTSDEDKHNSLRGMPEIYVQINQVLVYKVNLLF